MSSKSALPTAPLLTAQAAWLAPARDYLLRRVGIGQRTRVLDLGAGRGAVTPELLRRAGGQVVALDLDLPALREVLPEAARVGGDARTLPLASASLDLVFSQLTLLWVRPLAAVLDEMARVLRPGGALVALEPDYGGLIEYPPAVGTRAIWMAALSREGADPCVGRKLPGALEERHFDVRVDFQNRLVPPQPARFDLLRGLPLTAKERTALQLAEDAAEESEGRWSVVAHLPFFFVTAIKS